MSVTKESNNLAGWPDDLRKFYDDNLREKVNAIYKVCKDNQLCCVMAFELKEGLPYTLSAYKPEGAKVSKELETMFLIGRLGLTEGLARVAFSILIEHFNHE